MLYLYIDTTERDMFTIGVFSENKILKIKTVKSARQHSAKLLSSINKLLQSADKKLTDIKAIAVVRGPGSFTSLRIGIATANALGYALDAPVVGIKSSNEIIDKFFVPDKIRSLFKKRKASIVLPEYGSEPY